MGWFDVLDSFAKGTLVEDTLQRIDEGLGTVEKIIGDGEKQVTTLVDNLENGVQQVVDGADKAAATADKVIDVVNKLPTKE